MPNRHEREQQIVVPTNTDTVSMLEEASACPICKQPGKEVRRDRQRTPTGKMATILTINCENERCRWNGTGWVVQLNDDGSIPVRNPNKKGGDREFEEMSPIFKEHAQREIEEMRHLMETGGDQAPRGPS